MQGDRVVRPRLSPKEWSKIVARYRESGKTQADFCRDEGLSLTTLQKRLYRSRPKPRSAFADVTPTAASDSSASRWQIEVQLPAGVSIRLTS